MALEFIGGTLFNLLYDGVKQAMCKNAKLKFLLGDLKSTLDSLLPRDIQQIGDHNVELGLPNEEIESLKLQMEEGVKLVRKFSKFRMWNYYCCINDYTDQIVELDRSLKRLLEKLKLQEVRDVKELLILARTIKDKQDELERKMGDILKMQQETRDAMQSFVSGGSNTETVPRQIEGNGVGQVASVEGRAALGAVFGMLFDVVLGVKDKTMMFKPLLGDLKSTLDSLKPMIEEIVEHNKVLNRPKEELEHFRIQMEKGVELVHKCSKVRLWVSYQQYKYTDKLLGLDKSLQRLLNTLKMQVARDVRETLVSVRNIEAMIKQIEESGVVQNQIQTIGWCAAPESSSPAPESSSLIIESSSPAPESPSLVIESSSPVIESSSPTVGLDVPNVQGTWDVKEALVSVRNTKAGVNQIEGSGVVENQIEKKGTSGNRSRNTVSNSSSSSARRSQFSEAANPRMDKSQSYLIESWKMERTRLDLRFHHSGSTQTEESALDLERNYCSHPNLPSSSPPALQPFASSGQHSETAYFSWPTLSRLNDAAEDRANYFGNLQKGVLPETLGRLPSGLQATTLLELMTIRAFHSKILRRFSLGTAIGFRIQKGVLTDIPAILVFVARKDRRQWLSRRLCLPAALEGPGGVWCDVDVVEFSYYGSPAPTPKEQLYTELADGLRGSDPCIGSGSQVASQETYGTLGAIVKSRTGNRQVGFLTNRHVAVDLDYPNQKMFHPLPPSLGPGVYLGAVERATSFIPDDLWYGIFAATNPETFVRADGAFIPFSEDFNMKNVTTTVRGVGEIGDVNIIDLQSPINSLIGRQVTKVGRSSGLTTGTIMAYALEYNDENGICFFTDFLVVGENQQSFDLEGDSGSLILLTGQNGEKPRPVGIIWGGTANRGRLKLKVGQPPENLTSGVDLGRLLDLLELDLVTTNEGLQAAIQEQRNASAAGIDSTVGESSPAVRAPSKDKLEDSFGPLSLNLQQIPSLQLGEPEEISLFWE